MLELAGFAVLELGFFAVEGFFFFAASAGPSSTTVVLAAGGGAAAARARAVLTLISSVCCDWLAFRIESPRDPRALSRLLKAPCSAFTSLSGAARFAVSTTRSSVSYSASTFRYTANAAGTDPGAASACCRRFASVPFRSRWIEETS